MTIETVGIIGSGIMGSGLAEVATKAGYKVVLRSRNADTAVACAKCVSAGLAKQVAKGKITEADKVQIESRLTTTANLKDLADCDLIIESVVEDLATKINLFKELDQIAKPSTILATNTSTLPALIL